jgi:hypothetical protein
MRLPDEIFDEIVLHAGSGFGPGAARPSGAADERRREPRLCLDAAVAFTRYGSLASATRAAGLRDLSPGGVGLVLRDELVAPGELFVVHPPRGEGDRLDLLCTARAVRVGRDGAFYVGAEFCSPDEPDVVDHLSLVKATVCGSIRNGDALPARIDRRALWGFTSGRGDLDPAAPRRRDHRSALRARGQLTPWRADGTCGPAEAVDVVDLSPDGVGLRRPGPMRPGEQFMIRVPRVDEPPVTQFCAVARVTGCGESWLIGARFIPFGRRHGLGWLGRLFDWVV